VSRQGILLIAHDQLLLQRLTQAFASHGLPSPTHVSDGDQAIEWLEEHACAICLLDFDIPGSDGLRNLARLHQRHPDLPVLAMSSAGSEGIAISAFRAGVRDYIPKEPGFATVVAQHVRFILRIDSTGRLPQPIVVGPEISERLRQPTYQNRMRVIGREMDLGEYRFVGLWEVGGGFLARGTRPGRRTAEALEFLDRDFPQLVAVTARGDGERRQRSGVLIPTGYEDLFRSIGRKLDERTAEAVVFTELSELIVVSGLAKKESAAHVAPAPFEWVLDADGISKMLDEAYRLREATPAQQPGLLKRWART
jgi:DNA-binding NarL/FixJ family response regulator